MPADWNNGDVLAWIAMLLRNFDPDALDTGQIDNAALYQDLGPVMFQDLRWTNDPEAQTYIVDGINQGNSYEPRHDRTHVVNAVYNMDIRNVLRYLT